MSNLAFNIFQAKWMLGIAGSISIFVWTEEKIGGQIQSMVAWSRAEGPGSSAALKRMIISTGVTQDGGLVSSFFQVENIHRRQNLVIQFCLTWDVWTPSSDFWQTRQMASSTEQFRFGLLLGKILPSLQHNPKAWRSVTGLATFETSGFA